MEPAVEATTASVSEARRTWFAVLAAVFAVVFGTVLFGWIGLFAGWFSNQDAGIHRVHDIGGSGVATGIFVSGALLALLWRRDDIALLQMVAATGIAYGIASVIATDWVSLAYLPIIAIPVVALLAVSRSWTPFVSAGEGFAVATFVVTVVSGVFWVIYALSMAKLERIGSSADPHIEMHHWTGMAGMALGIVLLGFLASAKTRGWKTVAVLTGLGSAVFGLASVVFAKFPGADFPYAGGEGAMWGLLAIAGGVLLIAAAWWDARRA
jgi:hypothetical protein